MVLPAATVEVVLLASAWGIRNASVNAWILGLAAALGLLAWVGRAGTLAAAFTGAVITASLMYGTAAEPFRPWRTALVPIVTLLVLTSLATRFGRAHKQRLGTAEKRRGRAASQVAANLGVALLAGTPMMQDYLAGILGDSASARLPMFTVALAALAEAAADTVSSEIGQVLGGAPVMLTTFRRVEPGTDGAISLAGTLAGVLAAGFVSAAGTLALGGGAAMLATSWAAGIIGLFFDSFLGATFEREGLLNNDAVNLISTECAACAAGMIIALVHLA